MIAGKEQLVLDGWVKGVYEKSDILDPDDQHDWKSLALGFALGAGATPEEAFKFVDMLSERRLL